MVTATPIPPDAPSKHEAQNPGFQTPPETAAADSADCSPPTAHFPPRIPRGKRDRWTPYKRRRVLTTAFTPELVTEILETIERFGFTDTEAALHCQVSPSTLNRWKQEDPEFEDFLGGGRTEFASNQIHTIYSFTRRDGQQDPQGAKWLLERSNPERWGRPSASRTNPQQRTKHQEPGTAEDAAVPKPNTPEYWDYVEEEPFPRNLSTCTFTAGREKFYGIYHLVSMCYLDQPKFRDRPPVDPESDQGKRELESFFRLQEMYFALPKEHRIPFLHKEMERQYEKVLSREERAAVDLAVGSSSSSS